MAYRYLLKYTQIAAGLFFFSEIKKSGRKTPLSRRRRCLPLKKVEVVDIGRLTEKEARINMEK